ncbi:MAG: hypothetical protein Ct9H300mP31_18650 [Acidimicrobiaceae bacterium]|nr:MAG: hypothetical protein Ct9H300mP31_18650 [Acidimicrobiaceae bacterium]
MPSEPNWIGGASTCPSSGATGTPTRSGRPVAAMSNAGVRRALAWTASPYASYETCRRYGENLEAAQTAVGPGAPVIDRVRRHHDHPGLINPAADRLAQALDRLPAQTHGTGPTSCSPPIAFRPPWPTPAPTWPNSATRHAWAPSGWIPSIGTTTRWSGSPVGLAAGPVAGARRRRPDPGPGGPGVDAVAVSPIGFPVENFEVAWDLDVEASGRAADAGVAFTRAEAVGTILASSPWWWTSLSRDSATNPNQSDRASDPSASRSTPAPRRAAQDPAPDPHRPAEIPERR